MRKTIVFFAVIVFMTGCGCDNGVNPDNGVHIYTLTTEIAPTGSGFITRDPNQAGYVAGTGTVVTLTATPYSGYMFTDWSGASKSTDLSITVTMNSNLTLVANFQSTDGGNFTDSRDGQTYRTVVMPDGKTWMAENLNYQTNNSWYHDNNVSNCNTYGRLYTWDAAIVACPAGWRLPTRTDWGALVRAVGGSSIAGTKLKSQSWWGYGGNGTDDFGFSALPSGCRLDGGYFFYVSGRSYWWTATASGSGFAYYQYIGMGSNVVENSSVKNDGFSARCIKE